MFLFDLIKKDEAVTSADTVNVSVSGVKCDSRLICPNDVFFLISDDSSYVAEAVNRGASAIVVSDGVCTVCDVPVVKVPNVRMAYAVACQRSFGDPSKKMHLIGVTGTNGKTSVCMTVRHILECAGHNVGAISTIGNYIGPIKYETSYTTPPPDVLAQLFDRMAKAGTEYVVMETSSHALDQYRTAGLEFDVGIFTNLTRDHLDYHGTIDACATSKSRLFESSRISVINCDDEHASVMTNAASGEIIRCSQTDVKADYHAGNGITNDFGCEYDLSYKSGKTHIKTPLIGNFNIQNTMLAFACARSVGTDEKTIVNALASINPVQGRMETIRVGDATVVIDYAHTPDALQKVLEFLNKICRRYLITVFGCGGDRDRGKRAVMGKIAEKYSDAVILTEDNSRSESTMDIIDDILSGFDDKNHAIVIPNRYRAIIYTLCTAGDGDIVLLAGKGHEDYIIDSTGKKPFSERQIINEYIKRTK
ncbi:MAG: UDP-N-acetylmuramoyl-L-alanyl-D-glutamate--2,6-diaminopimelate ligase [Clostridia bacterium]|nr:UDP-N-acetylmuramoyl-L-alanyl-D-glutamate--2,6-diaminopimelate ligase [Clostridia bacterium]